MEFEACIIVVGDAGKDGVGVCTDMTVGHLTMVSRDGAIMTCDAQDSTVKVCAIGCQLKGFDILLTAMIRAHRGGREGG